MLHVIVGYVGLVLFSLVGVGLLLALPRHPRLALYSVLLAFLFVTESLNQVLVMDGTQNLGQTLLNGLVWAVALCEFLQATMSSSDAVLDHVHQVALPSREHMVLCSTRAALVLVIGLVVGNFSQPEAVRAISLLLVAPLCILLLLHVHVGNMWRSSRRIQLWLCVFGSAGLLGLVMAALGPGYFQVVSAQSLWISMLPTHLVLLIGTAGLVKESKINGGGIIDGKPPTSLDDDDSSGLDVLRMGR